MHLYDSADKAKDTDDTLWAVRNNLLEHMLGWTRTKWVPRVGKVPKQDNNFSCDAFVLWWAKKVVKDGLRELTRPPDNWRTLIKATLLTKPDVAM